MWSDNRIFCCLQEESNDQGRETESGERERQEGEEKQEETQQREEQAAAPSKQSPYFSASQNTQNIWVAVVSYLSIYFVTIFFYLYLQCNLL